jgi:hypothetical protein
MHYVPVPISVTTLPAYYTPFLTPCNGPLWTHMAFSADLCFERSSTQWVASHVHRKRRLSFSRINPLNMLVHKIQCCLMTCAAEFVNHGCLIRMQMSQLCCILHFNRHTYLVHKLSQRFSWRSPIEHQLQTVYPQTVSVFYMFSYHLKWKLLLKNFTHICTMFHQTKLAHWETFILNQNHNISCRNCICFLFVLF